MSARRRQRAAWSIRAAYASQMVAQRAAVAARTARVASAQVDIESWVRNVSAQISDPHTRALQLARAAHSLAEVNRVHGAFELCVDALLSARLAGRETILEALADIAPVLAAADKRAELIAIAGVLDEFKDW
jgi:hypothetical protein